MSKWISVEERLPEQGDSVDIWTTNGRRITDAWRSIAFSGEWYWATETDPDPFSYGVMGGIYEIPNVTHWMPLPEPPEESE